MVKESHSQAYRYLEHYHRRVLKGKEGHNSNNEFGNKLIADDYFCILNTEHVLELGVLLIGGQGSRTSGITGSMC
jgi:hypothetical protein